MQTLQFALSICVSWTVISIVSGSVTVANLFREVEKRPEVYSLSAFLLLQMACIAISSMIGMSGMPALLRSYTLVSSIEMMKKREVIEDVLRQQKTEKNARTYRVFQAMRLMRREYMQMVSVGGFNLSMSTSDSNSDYGQEESKPHPAMSIVSEIQMPEQLC